MLSSSKRKSAPSTEEQQPENLAKKQRKTPLDTLRMVPSRDVYLAWPELTFSQAANRSCNSYRLTKGTNLKATFPTKDSLCVIIRDPAYFGTVESFQKRQKEVADFILARLAFRQAHGDVDQLLSQIQPATPDEIEKISEHFFLKFGRPMQLEENFVFQKSELTLEQLKSREQKQSEPQPKPKKVHGASTTSMLSQLSTRASAVRAEEKESTLAQEVRRLQNSIDTKINHIIFLLRNSSSSSKQLFHDERKRIEAAKQGYDDVKILIENILKNPEGPKKDEKLGKIIALLEPIDAFTMPEKITDSELDHFYGIMVFSTDSIQLFFGNVEKAIEKRSNVPHSMPEAGFFSKDGSLSMPAPVEESSSKPSAPQYGFSLVS